MLLDHYRAVAETSRERFGSCAVIGTYRYGELLSASEADAEASGFDEGCRNAGTKELLKGNRRPMRIEGGKRAAVELEAASALRSSDCHQGHSYEAVEWRLHEL